jgi:hypothetical protein
VEDVPVEPLQELEENASNTTDFEIIGHRLNFLGLCPECRRKGNVAPAPQSRQEPTPLVDKKDD